jgi:hypothetical protein
MAAEIFAGLGAIKSAFDLAKGLQNIHDAAVRDTVVIELQREILAAQSEQAALIERIHKLEAKVASFEKWEAEKDRYQLKDFGGNTFAYELKADKAASEPIHRICPNCYETQRRHILQFKGQNAFSQDHYHCPGCDKKFEFGRKIPPDPAQYQGWSSRRRI